MPKQSERKTKKMPKVKNAKQLSIAWFVMVVAVLIIDYYANFGLTTEWFVALFSLFIAGIAIKEMNGLQGWLRRDQMWGVLPDEVVQ